MNPDNIDIENDIEKQDHEQLIIKNNQNHKNIINKKKIRKKQEKHHQQHLTNTQQNFNNIQQQQQQQQLNLNMLDGQQIEQVLRYCSQNFLNIAPMQKSNTNNDDPYQQNNPLYQSHNNKQQYNIFIQQNTNNNNTNTHFQNHNTLHQQQQQQNNFMVIPQQQQNNNKSSNNVNKHQIAELINQIEITIQLILQNIIFSQNNPLIQQKSIALLHNFLEGKKKFLTQHNPQKLDQLLTHIYLKIFNPQDEHNLNYYALPQQSLYQVPLLEFESNIQEIKNNDNIEDQKKQLKKFTPFIKELYLPEFNIWQQRGQSRSKFTTLEDNLLYLGIAKYGSKQIEMIQQIFLQDKNIQEIRHRYKNLVCQKAPDNPIKQWKIRQSSNLSENEKEQLLKGILWFGEQWELISKYFIPERSSLFLEMEFHQKPQLIKKRKHNGIEIIKIDYPTQLEKYREIHQQKLQQQKNSLQIPHTHNIFENNPQYNNNTTSANNSPLKSTNKFSPFHANITPNHNSNNNQNNNTNQNNNFFNKKHNFNQQQQNQQQQQQFFHLFHPNAPNNNINNNNIQNYNNDHNTPHNTIYNKNSISNHHQNSNLYHHNNEESVNFNNIYSMQQNNNTNNNNQFQISSKSPLKSPFNTKNTYSNNNIQQFDQNSQNSILFNNKNNNNINNNKLTPLSTHNLNSNFLQVNTLTNNNQDNKIQDLDPNNNNINNNTKNFFNNSNSNNNFNNPHQQQQNQQQQQQEENNSNFTRYFNFEENKSMNEGNFKVIDGVRWEFDEID